MVADITVFDPETVTDKATYEKGTLPSEGIPYVVVNGTIVVKDSQVLEGRQSRPAHPVRTREEPLRADHRRELGADLLCRADGFRRRRAGSPAPQHGRT
jgi:formylmethanofuran dehydrogenase subunit A